MTKILGNYKCIDLHWDGKDVAGVKKAHGSESRWPSYGVAVFRELDLQWRKERVYGRIAMMFFRPRGQSAVALPVDFGCQVQTFPVSWPLADLCNGGLVVNLTVCDYDVQELTTEDGHASSPRPEPLLEWIWSWG